MHRRPLLRLTPSRTLCLACILGGLALTGSALWLKLKGSWVAGCQVPIKAIVQTGPLKEALKTAYLAELLGLSVDRPVLTGDFVIKEGETRLLASPVIKEAHIQMRAPGTLYIDYATRKPVALLGDYENIALDADGYPFPLSPFFTPKKLPEIYLNMGEEIRFNRPICGEKKDLAFAVAELVKGPIVCDLLNVSRIDVSKAFEKSYGRREIVLQTEDIIYCEQGGREMCFHYPRLLRLSTKNFSQDLANYLQLREKLLNKEQQERVVPKGGGSTVFVEEKIIDLRIPQLAFIDEGGHDRRSY